MSTMLEKKSTHRILAIAVTVLILSGPGCISVGTLEYPDQWPALKAEEPLDCRDISGTYVNVAETLDRVESVDPPKGDYAMDQKSRDHSQQAKQRVATCHANDDGTIDPPCLLSLLFAPEYKGYLRTAPSYYGVKEHLDYVVRLEQEEDRFLSVQVIDTKDGAVVNSYRHDLSEGKIRCKNSAYKWSHSVSDSMGGWALLIGSIAHELSVAEDGSLVLKFRISGGGLVTIVPTAFGGSTWYRWERYDESG